MPLHQCKCTRCRLVHEESKRVSKPRPRQALAAVQLSDTCCPSCGCKVFYDVTPMVAWCWASGLIELGAEMPADTPEGGPILLASGPKYSLAPLMNAVARHGKGKSEGALLVPGVPEAETDAAKADALYAFLMWASKGRVRARDGIRFNVPKAGPVTAEVSA